MGRSRRRTDRKPQTPRPASSRHEPSRVSAGESSAAAEAAVEVAAVEVAAAAAAAVDVSPATTANRLAPLRHRIDDLIEQIHQSTNRLAQDDPSRGDLKILARTILELRYAFKVFTPYRSKRKVTVFGSARTPPDDPSYQQAVQLGRLFAKNGWLVVTGAASGIMEAGHLGAGRENSMGLNIMLPFEQEANRIIADDPKLVHMKYFFTRKLMFVKECHAVCLLPGGFGTLDEGMEVLTLIQTGKRDMIPIVLLDAPGGYYWRGFDQFIRDKLLARGMIGPADMSLFRVTDNVDEAVDEILGFFGVYHSMRYVHERLVLRLARPIDDALLDTLNRQFADIVVRGSIVRSAALPEERDEPGLADLPRLVFQFNRYDQGRLRQLIDCLNDIK
jgi:uncharacterized protein (TIGR00730 family)